MRLAGRLRRRADYQRPALDIGASYKEGQGEVPGWKPAEPRDQVDRGAWWRVYGDATLDGLVERLNASNQTIAQAEANYRQALGLVRGARAGFFPTVGANAGVTRSGSGGGTQGGSSSSGGNVSNQYSLSGSVSWELDVWARAPLGRVIRGQRRRQPGRSGRHAAERRPAWC